MLHTECSGRGPDLVMLHGWGMHSAIWGECAGQLARRFRVTLVDLPGHGRSRSCAAMESLASLVEAIAEVAPPRAIWVGWSLGGLAALRAALDLPQRLAGLVLVATNASFVQRPGWPWAQSEAILEGFADELARDHRGVLRRFVALQVRGSDAERQQLHILRERLFLHETPDSGMLEAGLRLLKQSDLRAELPCVDRPVLQVAGERDRLVPVEAAIRQAALLPGGALEVLTGAGHAPFLSHPDRFCEVVEAFIDERISSG